MLTTALSSTEMYLNSHIVIIHISAKLQTAKLDFNWNYKVATKWSPCFIIIFQQIVVAALQI